MPQINDTMTEYEEKPSCYLHFTIDYLTYHIYPDVMHAHLLYTLQFWTAACKKGSQQTIM